MHAALAAFHPVIARWFEDRLGLPTPPQVLGWPHIAAGESTLILAPTGSGKTLAAFLAAIDWIARALLENPDLRGVQILYLSPLKSLANDVQKNLTLPLTQIADTAAAMGQEWPEIRVAVRTGDTPRKERAAIQRHPPHILITTPESCNLMLTSAARTALSTLRYVIVDEVHALAGNKRGVFTSLLLERLEELRKNPDVRRGRLKIAPGVYVPVTPPGPLVRVGLSATARPEEAIARWLGGYDDAGDPRPVAICRAGQRKRLDLGVVCPFTVGDPDEDAPKTHWPQVVARVHTLIREHHSTLVFANSRRVVEKLAVRLLETDDPPAILPHHGSISKEVRLETEQKLKRGELKAVIATSSLELGIDIGALDLVIQLDSPGTVAGALQRVGRAGHLEKATAKGRLVARRMAELPGLAALVPLMYEGHVEETRTPENCLDVLAQQIVAACATRVWPRAELYRVLRRATPYHTLSEDQFDSVVAMLARKTDRTTAQGLRPKISWDRVNDPLIALPSGARLAITNGGVITDTGAYPVYIAETRTRIGELDEEFVFETKEGDRILLGSQMWQVVSIDVDRVTVTPAKPGTSRMPFWRGEQAPRSEMLGEAQGALCRELERRYSADEDAARTWLISELRLDDAAADTLLEFVQRQRASGALPTDQRIVIEHFIDRTGEPLLAILCPLGTRVNYALRLALEAAFAQRRLPAQFIHQDDGILIRPPAENAPENPLAWLTAEALETLILGQLENSALFGLRFRQNAARALMLPRPNVGQRTPLWQQRLRARHLLALVQQERNFPIIVETYRECLQDALQIDHARRLLAGIAAGDVQVAVVRHPAPSPMAWELAGSFQQEFQYGSDDPLQGAEPTVDPTVLDAILQRGAAPARRGPIWTDADIATLARRISGSEYPARNAEELLEKIEAAGLVTLGPPDDLAWREWTQGDPVALLNELQDARRVVLVELQPGDLRWGATESLALLIAALGHLPALRRYHGNTPAPLAADILPPALLAPTLPRGEAQRLLVEAALKRAPIVSQEALRQQLPFLQDVLPQILEHLVRSGFATRMSEGQYALAEYVDQLRNIALRRERHRAVAADPAALQRHLLRWHHIVDPRAGIDAVEDTLDTLLGLRLELDTWEHDIFPLRVRDFVPAMLEEVCSTGHRVWVGYADETIAFWPRHLLTQRPHAAPPALSDAATRVLDFLRRAGASFQVDVELALNLTTDETAAALRELARAGMISNDRLAALRHVLATIPAEAAHAAALPRKRMHAGWWKSAAAGAGGRWFVLPPADTPREPLALAELAAERVTRLLRRHGFACRELLDPPVDGPWRANYDVLTRMEWAGSVRRGYFVEGITGSQFAAPGVELTASGSTGLQWLALLDPANLYARLEPAWRTLGSAPARVPRVPGSWLALLDGRPVLAATTWGERLLPLTDDQPALAVALRHVGELLTRLPHARRPNLLVRYWAEQDIINSPAEPALVADGFVRDMQGLRRYRF